MAGLMDSGGRSGFWRRISGWLMAVVMDKKSGEMDYRGGLSVPFVS